MVRLNCLDFLNISPNFFIFQSKTNKTNFGGFLFLIYIIIMILISLAYILDYALNEKYEIETSTITYRYKSFDASPNPEIDIQVTLYLKEDMTNMTDRFFMKLNNHYYKGVYNQTIGDDYDIFGIKGEIQYHLKTNYPNIEDKKVELYYKCEYPDCHEIDQEYNNIDQVSSIFLATKRYIVDHYDKNPLKVSKDYDEKNQFLYSEEDSFFATIHWTSIVYKENQGVSRLFNNLLGIQENSTGGYIEYNEEKDLNFYSYKYHYDVDEDKNKVIIHGTFKFEQEKYIEYKRKEIEFTDVIAKIGALFSTLNFIFSTIYKFYSRNFDNYKIIDKILEYQDINKKRVLINNNIKNKDDESNEINKICLPLIKDNDEKDKEMKKEENKFDTFLKEKSNEKKEINNYDFNNYVEEMIEKEKNIYLPKLSFFDFFLRNIYCKKCKKNKKQEIINICNQIIAKYSSIDRVIIYLMKIDNLYKDYKWNNPKLNDLKSDESLKSLYNLLEI